MSPSKAEMRAQKAAEIKAAQARRERNRRFLTIGGVVLVMALIVGGSILFSMLSKTEVEPADVGTSAYGFTYGDPNAPHAVVIYEDFLCPHCGTLEAAAGEGLAEEAEAGNVLVDYRPVAILGEDSERTLNAFKVVLEAAGPEVAKEFHDRLFAGQSRGVPDDDRLVELAVDSGADEADVRGGIEGMDHAAWVTEATEAAAEDGLEGTPTIHLDGAEFRDGRSWEQIGENLVAAVSEE